MGRCREANQSEALSVLRDQSRQWGVREKDNAWHRGCTQQQPAGWQPAHPMSHRALPLSHRATSTACGKAGGSVVCLDGLDGRHT